VPGEFDGKRSIWLLKKASETGEYTNSKTETVFLYLWLNRLKTLNLRKI